LLDTSKGWTLHIPGPEESGSSAAKLIANQNDKPAKQPAPPTDATDVATAAAPAPALASR
jgi:hypothetical protein